MTRELKGPPLIAQGELPDMRTFDTALPSTLELDLAERELLDLERRLREESASLEGRAADMWRRVNRLKHAALSLSEVSRPDPSVVAVAHKVARRPFPALTVPEGVLSAVALRKKTIEARVAATEAVRKLLAAYARELEDVAELLERDTKELIQRGHEAARRSTQGVAQDPPSTPSARSA